MLQRTHIHLATRRRPSRGLTVFELMVVLLIFGTLFAGYFINDHSSRRAAATASAIATGVGIEQIVRCYSTRPNFDGISPTSVSDGCNAFVERRFGNGATRQVTNQFGGVLVFSAEGLDPRPGSVLVVQDPSIPREACYYYVREIWPYVHTIHMSATSAGAPTTPVEVKGNQYANHNSLESQILAVCDSASMFTAVLRVAKV